MTSAKSGISLRRCCCQNSPLSNHRPSANSNESWFSSDETCSRKEVLSFANILANEYSFKKNINQPTDNNDIAGVAPSKQKHQCKFELGDISKGIHSLIKFAPSFYGRSLDLSNISKLKNTPKSRFSDQDHDRQLVLNKYS